MKATRQPWVRSPKVIPEKDRSVAHQLAESNNPSSESSVGQNAGAGDVTSGQSGDVSAASGGDQNSGGNNPDGTGRDNYNTIYAPRERIGGSE